MQNFKNEEWVSSVLNNVDLDESVIDWAMSSLQVADVHKDAFGNILENGDNVVLHKRLMLREQALLLQKVLW